MKKRQRLWLFVALSLLSLTVNAQNSPTDANSKTDASLQGSGKMGDLYDVNLYDGTVNVNIPIYNYSLSGMNLGVALSYDARGVKVNQAAGSVGLNWSLLAGGYIERTIKGVPEEIHPTALSHHTGTGPHTVPCPDDRALETDYKGKWTFAYWDPNVRDDGENDLFMVNMGGTSFKMTIPAMDYDAGNNLKGVITSPKRELKVHVYHNGNQLGYGGAFEGLDETDSTDYIYFVITDEKGNNFYFYPGDVQYSYHTAPDALNPYYRYRTQRWVLTKIETITGNQVNYSYRKFSNINYPYYRVQQVRERWNHFEVIDNASTYFDDTLKVEADSIENWRGWVSHVSKIEYPNGTNIIFNFEDDPNHPRCDLEGKDIVKSIRIESKLDNTNAINAKTFRFNYAYFHTPIPANQDTEIPYTSSCNDIRQTFGLLPGGLVFYHQLQGLRLKLKGIDIIGTDNVSSLPYYSFEYNSTPLPERLSPSQDYFGYYNGKMPQYLVNNVSNPVNLAGMGMPLHTYTYSNGNSSITYGVDKMPDINYTGAWNLKKIKNGSGGAIEFFFKDHSLYNPANSYSNFNSLLPADYEGENANDGLCIDKIVFTDGYNVDNTTYTKYAFDDGQRFFRGGYCWIYGYKVGGSDTTGYSSNPHHAGTLSYYSEYVTPLMLVNNSNHGYTYATVKNYGYDNQLLGSVKYKFSNLMDDAGHSNLKMKLGFQQHTHHPEYFYDYQMGLPLEISTYDMNGDIVSKVTNTYAANSLPSGYPNTYGSSRTTYEGGPGNDNYSDFYSTKMVKTATTSITYSGQNSMSGTLNLTYDKRDNLTTASWTDANGDMNTKKFFYNYTPVNGQPLIDSVTFTTDRHYLVNTEVWKNTGGNDYILSYNYATPPSSGPGSNNYRSLKTNQPVTLTQYNNSSFLSNMVSEDKQLSLDNRGNAIETRFENGAMYNAAIWDTRIGQKIADAGNARYNEIAYTSFEGSYGNQGTFEYSKGNWDFNPSGIIYSFTNGLIRPMTGRYHYQLTAGGNTVNSFNALQSGKKYLLTFWATSAPQIQMGSQTVTSQVIGQKQYWKLCQAQLTGNGSAITISSASGTIHIDELRLQPQDAKMTTATYEPLLGLSSEADGRNNITYYEYDGMGNLKLTRDINGNIRMLTKTVVQGSDN